MKKFAVAAFAAEAVEESEAFYRRCNDRAWRYGMELLPLKEGVEREKIERDLASSAFTYWFMRQQNMVPQNKTLEGNIVEACSRSHLIRQDILRNPLGRKTADERGLGLVGVVLTDEDYKKEVEGFSKFASPQ